MHKIDSRTVFEGAVFSVRQDIVESHGARRTIDVVAHSGSYAIIARPKPDQVILVRQFRYAVGAQLWELPAGKADPGEEPQAGALRELREETGFIAGRIREVLSTYMTPGFCTELMRYYLADDLQPGPTAFDDDEEIETLILPLDEALALLAGGQIMDAKTAVGLLLLDQLRH